MTEFQRELAAYAGRLGKGPYVVVAQVRTMDIDGYGDTFEVVGSFADRGEAETALERVFADHCDHRMRDDASWHDEPYVVPIAPDETVRLLAERGMKRKDASGFNADTIVVQLFEQR